MSTSALDPLFIAYNTGADGGILCLHSEAIRSIQGYPRKLEMSRSMAGQSEIANAKKPVGRVGRCNAGAIKKAARRISLIYDKALAPTGLKITQYGILSAINATSAALPSMHELATALG